MSSRTHPAPDTQPLGFGFATALVLHAVAVAVVIGAAFLRPSHNTTWGEKQSQAGAIQASMVSSIPLPAKVPPVEKAVLAAENVTKAPEPPPKEKTAPPPRPEDLLVKEKVPVKIPPKMAPKAALEPPKHPQIIPETPKAASGEAATQLPQSTTPAKNGTATATIEDKAFGNRYAYYRSIVSRKVAENWFSSEADPRSSQGKHVVMRIEIQRDGSIGDMQTQTRSGSPSLDTSALHALQRIDTFGPLPAGDHVTVELTFDYHQP